jgi:hypothetical protein
MIAEKCLQKKVKKAGSYLLEVDSYQRMDRQPEQF